LDYTNKLDEAKPSQIWRASMAQAVKKALKKKNKAAYFEKLAAAAAQPGWVEAFIPITSMKSDGGMKTIEEAEGTEDMPRGVWLRQDEPTKREEIQFMVRTIADRRLMTVATETAATMESVIAILRLKAPLPPTRNLRILSSGGKEIIASHTIKMADIQDGHVITLLLRMNGGKRDADPTPVAMNVAETHAANEAEAAALAQEMAVEASLSASMERSEVDSADGRGHVNKLLQERKLGVLILG
jgi:hypothetical protein